METAGGALNCQSGSRHHREALEDAFQRRRVLAHP
jgi:hypothetical protein